jgi:hypothetical protein
MMWTNDAEKLEERNNYLRNLSQLSINDKVIYKLDHIATVYIYNVFYFNVYRRYNNRYEIVIEDLNGDFHLQQDNTVYQSLQNILCLSNEQMKTIYTENVFSFKYNSQPPTSNNIIPEMRWSEIQHKWCGIIVNFEGILQNYHKRPSYKLRTIQNNIDNQNIKKKVIKNKSFDNKYLSQYNYTVLRNGKMYNK